MLNEQTARDKADKLLRAVLDAPLTGTRIALLRSALLAAQKQAVEKAAQAAALGGYQHAASIVRSLIKE